MAPIALKLLYFTRLVCWSTKDLKVTGLALSKAPHDISSCSAKYGYTGDTQCCHQVPAVTKGSLHSARVEREPWRGLCWEKCLRLFGQMQRISFSVPESKFDHAKSLLNARLLRLISWQKVPPGDWYKECIISQKSPVIVQGVERRKKSRC